MLVRRWTTDDVTTGRPERDYRRPSSRRPSSVCQPPRRGQHLRHDLAGGQIARQPGLARGAEDAAHRAAGLRADADRAALVVQHQHGLDGEAIGQPEQPLDRLAVARPLLVDQLQRIDPRLGGQALPQLFGQIGHPGRVSGQLLVEPRPDLVGAIARLSPGGQQLGQLILGEFEK